MNFNIKNIVLKEINCVPCEERIERKQGHTIDSITKIELFPNNVNQFPDIDTDWELSMELKEGLKKEWGENSVIPVSNFITLQMRSLVKDVSKFYDIPYQEVNDVTSKMLFEATPPAKRDHDILAGVYMPTFEELRKYSKTFASFLNKYPKVANHLEALSNQVRTISRHASGCIIGENLNKYMPLIRSGDTIQTPWPEGQTIRLLEPMGFIKFDILGLASLRMMRQAIYLILKNRHNIENPSFEEIKKFYDENLHPNKIDFNDQNVYKHIFHEGRFHNVFQFQEKGVQAFCKLSKPKSLEDITIVTSTFRPGPLASGVDKKYLEAKDNPDTIEYAHPILKEILGSTFGNLIFQEQIASIVHKMGKNVSLEEGNQLRKLLVKRGDEKGGNKKEKIYKKYIEGCLEKGLTLEKSNEIWEAIEKSNSYLFNKCLYKNTIVETKEGIKKSIKDVKIGEYINSKNGFVKVKNVFSQGKKKVYKIRTKNGKELICTMEHKIETECGLKSLKEIIEKKYKIITK